MLSVFFATGLIFMIFIGLMAIGVICSRPPIQGSCGGIALVMGHKGPCEFCGKTQVSCQRRRQS